MLLENRKVASINVIGIDFKVGFIINIIIFGVIILEGRSFDNVTLSSLLTIVS
jgi:hypothetical protein